MVFSYPCLLCLLSICAGILVHTIISYCPIYHANTMGYYPVHPFMSLSAMFIYTGTLVRTIIGYCPIYHAHNHGLLHHTPLHVPVHLYGDISTHHHWLLLLYHAKYYRVLPHKPTALFLSYIITQSNPSRFRYDDSTYLTTARLIRWSFAVDLILAWFSSSRHTVWSIVGLIIIVANKLSVSLFRWEVYQSFLGIHRVFGWAFHVW